MVVLPTRVVFREEGVPNVCVWGQPSDALVWVVLEVVDGLDGIVTSTEPGPLP